MNNWLGKLLIVFAIEFEYLEKAITSLIREAIPGLARDLLANWEKDLGLPDASLNPIQTVEERAQIAHVKYTGRWTGQSKQFFVDYAASLGALISVYEYRGVGSSFRVSVNRVDRIPGSGTPEERIFGARLWSASSPYKWVVSFINITGSVSRSNIEQLIRDKAPAHTEVIFQ